MAPPARRTVRYVRREIPLHLMILPGLLVLIIYGYGPLFGLVMSFQKFVPTRGFLGSRWVGLANFAYLLQMPNTAQVLWNTFYISVLKITTGLVVSLSVALLLNEVRGDFFKRAVQTVVYLPHFISWPILAGILVDLLSPSYGVVNALLGRLGVRPVLFLGEPDLFPYVVVVTDLWKEFGFGTVVYLAAISTIDPNLYEAALIDGAGRWRRALRVTLPCISSTVVIIMVLSLGNILNAGFDQIFNLYNPMVYRTGDIIDTLVYRIGLENFQYSVAAAVGLFKSVVSFLLISLSYLAARRWAGYTIF